MSKTIRILDALQHHIDATVTATEGRSLSTDAEDHARVAAKLAGVLESLRAVGAHFDVAPDDSPSVPPFIDDDGWVFEWDGDEWELVTYVGDDPEIRADLGLDDDGVCDDPDCPCHADVCDDCGADLGFTDDDVIATLRVGDNGFAVNVQGPICEEHADLLRTDLAGDVSDRF